MIRSANKRKRDAREAITTYQDVYDLRPSSDTKLLSCINKFKRIVNPDISADKLGESDEHVLCQYFSEHDVCEYKGYCPYQHLQRDYTVALEEYKITNRWFRNFLRSTMRIL